MAKKKDTRPPIPDAALQYRDLSPGGQKILDQNMRAKGVGVKAKIQQRIDTQKSSLASGKISDPDRIHKAERSIENLAEVKKKAKNLPITMEGAAQRRVEHFEAGMARSAAEHGPGTIKGSGAGWYFEHAGKVSEAAHEAGVVSPRTAAIAGGVMSPQNSPANELATSTALMKQAAGRKDFERKDLKRGGTTANTAKAKKIITKSNDDPGPVGQVIPANTNPKVHSYTSAIVAGMPTHTEEGRRHISAHESEYRNRVGKVADVMSGKVTAEQDQLDLFGLKDSHEGLLSPTRNTAEDTWMSTITHGQSLENVGSSGRTNVGKTIASDTMMASSNLGKTRVNSKGKRESALSDPRYGKSAMGHAWNNEATIQAAEHVGQKYGVTDTKGNSNFPAVAMQETAWTEVRRVANKDPDYNRVKRNVSDSQFHQQSMGF